MFDILIITKDSYKFIDLIVSFWRLRGFDPLILVDDASGQETFDVLKRLGARHYPARNPVQGYADPITKTVRQYTSAKWILRLDDDELPNIRMINWVREILEGNPDKWSIGFTRRQLIFRDGILNYATGGPFKTWADGYLSIVWKLFQPDQVKFTDKIHTPGYENANWLLAPRDCHIMHFEWLVKTYTERKVKLQRYEAARPGAAFPHMSLYEDFPAENYEFKPCEGNEFDFIAYQLGIRGGTLSKHDFVKYDPSVQQYKTGENQKLDAGELLTSAEPNADPLSS